MLLGKIIMHNITYYAYLFCPKRDLSPNIKNLIRLINNGFLWWPVNIIIGRSTKHINRLPEFGDKQQN